MAWQGKTAIALRQCIATVILQRHRTCKTRKRRPWANKKSGNQIRLTLII